MKNIKDKLNKLNSDKKFVDRISAEEDKLYCYNSDIEIAKNMLKEDESIEKIIKYTGLSEKEVLLLKE